MKNKYFDSYDPVELAAIIDKQHKVTTYLNSQGHANMFQILIILDDFSDSPAFLPDKVNYYIDYTSEVVINVSRVSHLPKFTKLYRRLCVRISHTYLFFD